MKSHEHAQYTVTSPALRNKIGASVVSGCLALALAPTLAFADVADSPNGDAQGAGNPPAMQMPQGSMDGNGHTDDRMLEELFGTFDQVKADEGLKQRTLEAILNMDDAGAPSADGAPAAAGEDAGQAQGQAPDQGQGQNAGQGHGRGSMGQGQPQGGPEQR